MDKIIAIGIIAFLAGVLFTILWAWVVVWGDIFWLLAIVVTIVYAFLIGRFLYTVLTSESK